MTSKTIEKKYKGVTYLFTKDKIRGYKVSAKGFGNYWYQQTMSVMIADKKFHSDSVGALKNASQKKSIPRLPVKKNVTTVTKEKMSEVHVNASGFFSLINKEIDLVSKKINLLENYKKNSNVISEKNNFAKVINNQKKYLTKLKIQKNELKKFL